jgi:hypothetical protein
MGLEFRTWCTPKDGAEAPLVLFCAAFANAGDNVSFNSLTKFFHGVVSTYMNKVITKPKAFRQVKDVTARFIGIYISCYVKFVFSHLLTPKKTPRSSGHR